MGILKLLTGRPQKKYTTLKVQSKLEEALMLVIYISSVGGDLQQVIDVLKPIACVNFAEGGIERV